ncbi:DUF4193 domain-containing protein [Rhodococcus sp. ACS1]|uniref:DUF4193 domain-containing protein n=1 Tax=Rhodococcus koreensis TaxID=99653 RepID=A0A1H4MNG6_9NOCA|nr:MULTISPECIES: DUF4193 domain-containing protein [Rhodococcus]PBC52217.1 DUF4193 domain-containing protein [Rhodococcus sp. ACS1]QSE84464.1 DUF4193 domain-containing protein [Rhodococcus koreensis]SEB84208.1 protein of unknown function [Rhodococcus koreensis]
MTPGSADRLRPPRVTNTDDEPSERSLDQLEARRNESQSAVVDVEETDTAESFELPGADLFGEVFPVREIPEEADEFTCTSCFLVHHRSRLAGTAGGQMIYLDCAG